MSEAPVRPGDILAGKYRVERVLGAGNMGVVVAAMHVELGQRVALKFLQAGKVDPREQREQRERFLREARAAGRLKSQHVARVLDVGTLENEAPYIVMELLEGQDLSALLKARGPLPFEEAAMYMLQACEAVGEAHAAGIVHRDLKPANLFCAEDVGGAVCIKMLDFGISKLSGVDLTLTNEADVFGSPLYMSPEQMRSSKSVDARSDIWSLGVVLYQLVAGRTPFHSESITELCSKVLMGEAMPLSAYRGDAPAGFEAVILRCLERDREQRFGDVAAFAAALAPYAPEYARVYAGRVARAMGRKGAPAASVPEVPAARAPLSSSLGSAGALSVSASQTTPLAPKVAESGAAMPQGRGRSASAVTRAMAVVGVGVGIAGAAGVWFAQRRSAAPVAATASASASVSVLAPAAASASAPVPEGPPTGMEASQQPPTGGVEVTPVPSATAKADAKPSLRRAPSTSTARSVATATPAAPPAKPAAAPSSPKKREGIL